MAEFDQTAGQQFDLICVAGPIELWRTVEPPISEPRPASRERRGCKRRRIGRHARYAKLDEKCCCLGREPAGISRLASELRCGEFFHRQESIPGHSSFKLQLRWKLHKYDCQCVAEQLRFRQEIFNCPTAAPQFRHMRDRLWHLHREGKSVRNTVAPSCPRRKPMCTVERAIDLYDVKFARVSLERRAACRKPVGDFARDRPTRCSDLELHGVVSPQ